MSAGHVTVAGGGLAGAAAAIRLGRAGQAVTLLERTVVPTHKVCGEFLSREAAADLAELGLDLPALGAHPITHLRLVRAGRAVRVALPFDGFGLSRRRLDEALLARAAASGAAVERGQVFRHDRHRPPGPLLVATGKHDHRGLPRPCPDRAAHALVGFKLYLRLAPAAHAALAGHVELMLFADGYAGLQRVEDGLANLCLLTGRERLDRAGGRWSTLLASLAGDCPHLADRLAGADSHEPDRPLAIARVPFGFLHRPGPRDPTDLFRLGDQAAVIPALTGDGMSVALHTARRAADAVLAGDTAADYHRRLRRDLSGQLRVATALARFGRHPAGQAGLLGAARHLPGLIGLLATATRVNGRAGSPPPFP